MVSEIFMFEIVNGQTHTQTLALHLSYKLTSEFQSCILQLYLLFQQLLGILGQPLYISNFHNKTCKNFENRLMDNVFMAKMNLH